MYIVYDIILDIIKKPEISVFSLFYNGNKVQKIYKDSHQRFYKLLSANWNSLPVESFINRLDAMHDSTRFQDCFIKSNNSFNEINCCSIGRKCKCLVSN